MNIPLGSLDDSNAKDLQKSLKARIKKLTKEIGALEEGDPGSTGIQDNIDEAEAELAVVDKELKRLDGERKAMQDQLEGIDLFASMKPTAWKALFADLQFRSCAAGEVIVRQGEFTNEMYVLIEGVATAYRTEPGGSPTILGSVGAGSWFGEMAVLANQPRTATMKADAPCVLLVIDGTVFPNLHKDAKGSFHQLIEEEYRERALAFHLSTAPIFKKLPSNVLKKIALGSDIVTFANDQTIATEGDVADAVYLVRSGIVKRTIEDSGKTVIQEYLCDNSSFGERAASEEDSIWPATYATMSRCDLVRVPKELFQRLFESDAETATVLQGTVNALIAGEAGQEITAGTALEVMVGKEAVKGGEALVIDLAKCTRCNACVESCVSVHADGVPRLSKRGIRAGQQMLSSACYNCKIPECMLGCGFGAIRRDVHGQIHFIMDNCTGCTICQQKCPYGVIHMAEMADLASAPSPTETFLKDLPLIGKFFQKQQEAQEDPALKKSVKAIKCDLCAGLPFEACVYNCPCGAIVREAPESLVGFGS